MTCPRCRGSMLRDGRDLWCLSCGHVPSNAIPLGEVTADAPKRRREPTMPTRINFKRQPQVTQLELDFIEKRLHIEAGGNR